MSHRIDKKSSALSNKQALWWTGTLVLLLALATYLVPKVASWFEVETLAQVKGRIERVAVVLKGEKIPAGPVYAATGSDVYFVGPPNVEAEDGIGKRFPLHGEHGITSSPYRFYGPKGDTVFVDFVR